jgi:ATP-dependent exoDNAse (exonuclease V) beta subunit
MAALLAPNDAHAVRGALATRLLGRTGADLDRLAHAPVDWEVLNSTGLRDYRRHWERLGILAVIEDVIVAQASRLLAAADGERALTDLRHIGELLQEAASECYGPEELLAWFMRERAGATDDAEAGKERQLRIESEAKRVQLLTSHASKGLEYPSRLPADGLATSRGTPVHSPPPSSTTTPVACASICTRRAFKECKRQVERSSTCRRRCACSTWR